VGAARYMEYYTSRKRELLALSMFAILSPSSVQWGEWDKCGEDGHCEVAVLRGDPMAIGLYDG